MNILSRSIFFCFILLIFAAVAGSAQTIPRSGRIPADLVITLQRTMCFGTCPDYKLTIKANGSVLFKGEHFTDTKGAARSRIARSSLRELIREFRRSRFTSFANDYSRGGACEGYATDNPSEIISIHVNGKTKKVNHYFGCVGKAINERLKILVELGKTIDRVTDSKRWVAK